MLTNRRKKVTEFMKFVIDLSDDAKNVGFIAAAKKQIKIFWDTINDPRYNQDSFRD